MEEGKINPKNHAILIGINFYPIKPLNGCVRDVQEIKKYLDMLPDPVNTKMLTANLPDKSNPSRSVEDQKLWPTYDNVISSIKNISSSAQPGDFVYIHFSGHGTSTKPSNELSSASTGNLALVLLNEASDPDTRYLQGSELTQLLSDMVDKKLMVTLVLDCCQSGGVMRNDSSIRFLEYDPLVDAAYPPSHVQYLNPTYRHIATSYDWLRNPHGFMVITASGPHEVAREIKLNNGQYHGALSYFLLEAWKEFGGSRAKQRRIYEYLSTRVRDLCAGQNPMRYGANDQGFFGDALTDINQTSVLIVRKPDKSLQLQAGRIHGICNSDKFSLYPFGDVNPEFKFTETPIIAEVTDVRSLVSDLKLSNTTSIRVKTGWVATPLTCLSLRKFPIHIQAMPPYLNNWEAARKERQSLNIIDTNETSEQTIAFRVAQINEDDYEIKDECSNIIEQPTTTHHERKNLNHVLDVIEHIARFKLVSNIVNEALAGPTNSFRESFNVKLTNSIGKDFYPGCSQTGWFQPGCSHLECSVRVDDGDRIHLHVQNKGDYDLYVYVLSLGPLWEIQDALHANHAVIRAPRKPLEESNDSNNWKKGLKIRTPDIIKQRGQDQHEEVIKVFLTTRLTSFASLELPELGKSLKGVRPNTNRAIGGDGPPEDWAAVNFRIRVSSK